MSDVQAERDLLREFVDRISDLADLRSVDGSELRAILAASREPAPYRSTIDSLRDIRNVVDAVIDKHADHIATHYESCWMFHAGCLAVRIRDLHDETTARIGTTLAEELRADLEFETGRANENSLEAMRADRRAAVLRASMDRARAALDGGDVPRAASELVAAASHTQEALTWEQMGQLPAGAIVMHDGRPFRKRAARGWQCWMGEGNAALDERTVAASDVILLYVPLHNRSADGAVPAETS